MTGELVLGDRGFVRDNAMEVNASKTLLDVMEFMRNWFEK